MMDTERLIRTLSLDARRAAPMARAWAMALAAAAVVAALVFLALAGPRPDIASASQTWRFLFKFVVTLTLFGAGFSALAALARPGAVSGARLAWLLAAPGLLLFAAAVEAFVLPAGEIGARLVGQNALLCLVLIPLIGAGPLAAFLLVLRHGAPAAPELAGAVAGLAAGGLAATFYAMHCTDDSPLFVATWYSLAVLLLAAAGAAAARKIARW